MKSAYELAMERLAAEDPGAVRELTDSQRQALGEVTERFRAKRAEREVFLKGQMDAARAGGDRVEADRISRQLSDELGVLDEEEEREKDRIRNEGD